MSEESRNVNPEALAPNFKSAAFISKVWGGQHASRPDIYLWTLSTRPFWRVKRPASKENEINKKKTRTIRLTHEKLIITVLFFCLSHRPMGSCPWRCHFSPMKCHFSSAEWALTLAVAQRSSIKSRAQLSNPFHLKEPSLPVEEEGLGCGLWMDSCCSKISHHFTKRTEPFSVTTRSKEPESRAV